MVLQLFGKIENPYAGTYGETAGWGGTYGLGKFINNLIRGILVGGGLLLFLYLIFGGFRYLTAGGDEKAIDAAKKILTNAAVGLVIVVGAWFIAKILETVLGVNILSPEFVGPAGF